MSVDGMNQALDGNASKIKILEILSVKSWEENVFGERGDLWVEHKELFGSSRMIE